MNPLLMFGIALMILGLGFVIVGSQATWQDGYTAATRDARPTTAYRMASTDPR